MELFDLCIEDMHATLEDSLEASPQSKHIKQQLIILNAIAENHPKFEAIRLCLRDLSLSETVNLGEAYCTEAEITRLQEMASHYQNIVDDDPLIEKESTLEALVCGQLLTKAIQHLEHEHLEETVKTYALSEETGAL